MPKIEKCSSHWRLSGGNVTLDLDRQTGCLTGLSILTGKNFEWTRQPGDVKVRDDLLRKTFDRRDLKQVDYDVREDVLLITKVFHGVPWLLKERYAVREDAIHWEAEVQLDSNADFRSCSVSYDIPWPQPCYPVKFWAARENMPSALHRFAKIAFEYGEITSGILIPALCCYMDEKDAGLLLAMPFDFRAPRFRFIGGYREPDLQAEFDWMALAPGKSARTSLLIKGTGGDWRPALGWLYERFKEYFEPRSSLIHKLWGGHVCGSYDVSPEDSRAMAELDLRWYEIHLHFSAYGNYHPEDKTQWRSGHDKENDTLISVDTIRQAITNLHAVGAAALPYIQVTGDGDKELLDPAFQESRIRDWHGQYVTAWPETFLMNSDPSLPFGRDITRQIAGMVARYPDMDGVFLDQACYNLLDTAHDDGLTAVQNHPCYMTGLNYYPHLEHLSSLLHPEKVIIGNGPHAIGILKYIDGLMAEAQDWLCEHLQYLGLAKPIFFLVYETSDSAIELMFQRCLKHAAGFSSYPAAMPSKDLYAAYRPLLERLFHRRWVFDPNPLKLPLGLEGGLYRSPSGSLLASIVGNQPRLEGRSLNAHSVCVRTADTASVTRVTLQQAGGQEQDVPFTIDDDAVQFDIPARTTGAVAELHLPEAS